MACVDVEYEKANLGIHESAFSEEVVVENDENPIEVNFTDLDG